MRHIKSGRGFTLIELMVVVAIIALLASVAIPQFLRFRSKSIRTEAFITANGVHKAQISYFAGVNHFCTGGCDSFDCSPDAGQVQTINNILGIETIMVAGWPR